MSITTGYLLAAAFLTVTVFVIAFLFGVFIDGGFPEKSTRQAIVFATVAAGIIFSLGATDCIRRAKLKRL